MRQTSVVNSLFFAGNIFGFWQWITWFMTFLSNNKEEKKKAPFLESEIQLGRALYTHMVLSGTFLPPEESERDIVQCLSWIPESKVPYRAFVAERPLLPLAFEREAFHESALDDIQTFHQNFHGLEAGLIAALGLSVEEWIAGNYQMHLCKVIEEDTIALEAIERLRELNAGQIKILCGRIIQHLLH